jgi:type II secretory pathway pseudopilin PulG
MIEMVLVLALIGILLGMSVLYYGNSQVRADINTQASNIVHYLRLAQSAASSGLNNKSHGIHFEAASYTTFEGDSYLPTDPENFIVVLPQTMTINSISLNGNGNDVIFSKTNGETINQGTISLNSAQINKTIPITITTIGTINY